MAFSKNRKCAPGENPESGAIFMSNKWTKEACFETKCFALPSSYSEFVRKVKAGMILFLFDYQKRELHGVFQACTDGFVVKRTPRAFIEPGRDFPAQVQFRTIWHCMPLPESMFHDVIKRNYFKQWKFRFGLSMEQVRELVRLFDSKRIRVERPTRSTLDCDRNRYWTTIETGGASEDDRYDVANELGRKYIVKDVNSPRKLTKYIEPQREADSTFFVNDLGGAYNLVGYERDPSSNDYGVAPHEVRVSGDRLIHMSDLGGAGQNADDSFERDPPSNDYGIASDEVRVPGDGLIHMSEFGGGGQNADVIFEHVVSVGISPMISRREVPMQYAEEFAMSPMISRREAPMQYAEESGRNQTGSDYLYYDSTKLQAGCASKDLLNGDLSVPGFRGYSHRSDSDAVLTEPIKFDRSISSGYGHGLQDRHLQLSHANHSLSSFASGTITDADSFLLRGRAKESYVPYCQSRRSLTPSALSDPVTFNSFPRSTHEHGTCWRGGYCGPSNEVVSCALPTAGCYYENRNLVHDVSHHTSPGEAALSPLEKLSALSYVNCRDGPRRSPDIASSFTTFGHMVSSRPLSSFGMKGPNSPVFSARYSDGVGATTYNFENFERLPSGNAPPLLSEHSVGYRRPGKSDGNRTDLSVHEPSSIMMSQEPESLRATFKSYKSDHAHVELQTMGTSSSNALCADVVDCRHEDGKVSASLKRSSPEMINPSSQERKLFKSASSGSRRRRSVFSRLSPPDMNVDEAEHTRHGEENVVSIVDEVTLDEVMEMLTDTHRKVKREGKSKALARIDDERTPAIRKNDLPEEHPSASTNGDINEEKIEVNGGRAIMEKSQVAFNRCSERIKKTDVISLRGGIQESVTGRHHKLKREGKFKALAKPDHNRASPIGEDSLPDCYPTALTIRNKIDEKIEVNDGRDIVEKPRVALMRHGEKIQKASHETDVNSLRGMFQESVTGNKRKGKCKAFPKPDDDGTSAFGKHTLPEDHLSASANRNLDEVTVEEVNDGPGILEKPQVVFNRRCGKVQKPSHATDVDSLVGCSQGSVTDKRSKRRKLVRPFRNENLSSHKETLTPASSNIKSSEDEAQSCDVPAGNCVMEKNWESGNPQTASTQEGNGGNSEPSTDYMGEVMKSV